MFSDDVPILVRVGSHPSSLSNQHSWLMWPALAARAKKCDVCAEAYMLCTAEVLLSCADLRAGGDYNRNKCRGASCLLTVSTAK